MRNDDLLELLFTNCQVSTRDELVFIRPGDRERHPLLAQLLDERRSELGKLARKQVLETLQGESET
jgi:hypothetical protein